MLLLSVIMKANFFLGFLPAGILYLLIKHRSGIGVHWLSLLTFFPAILMMILQYYFNYYQSSSGVFLTFFGLWKRYSGHILGSILFDTAFPLSLLIFRFRSLFRNDYLLLSWLFYGVTFLQFAFLAEKKH